MFDPARGEEMIALPRTGLYRIVPARVRFPDGYVVDPHRDPPRFTQPVDTDTIAEVRMWSAPAVGMSMSVDVKDETPRVGGGGTLLQLQFRYRF